MRSVGFVVLARSSPPSARPVAPATGSASLEFANILVVEEGSATHDVLAAVINPCVVKLRSVRSAAQAKGCLSHEPFSLIVSETALPHGRVMALLAAVRDCGLKVPVVLVGDEKLNPIPNDTPGIGILGYRQRPLRLPDVLATVLDARSLSTIDLETRGSYDPRIARLASLMRRRLQTKIDLAEYARSVGIGLSRLRHLFRTQTGCSITRFFTSSRIEEAKWLLTATTVRVSEIAYEIGYDDLRSFHQAFRRSTGMGPRQFRYHALQQRQESEGV